MHVVCRRIYPFCHLYFCSKSLISLSWEPGQVTMAAVLNRLLTDFFLNCFNRFKGHIIFALSNHCPIGLVCSISTTFYDFLDHTQITLWSCQKVCAALSFFLVISLFSLLLKNIYLIAPPFIIDLFLFF